jgi:hypothetical protein
MNRGVQERRLFSRYQGVPGVLTSRSTLGWVGLGSTEFLSITKLSTGDEECSLLASTREHDEYD